MRIFKFLGFVAVAVMMVLGSACSSKSIKDKAMNVAIEEINKQLEGQKIPGIEKMSISVDDNYVFYNYVVDEEMVEMDDLKASAAEQKEEARKNVLRDPSNSKFVTMVKDSGRGMKFKYEGNKSGKGYDIVFENAEL